MRKPASMYTTAAATPAHPPRLTMLDDMPTRLYSTPSSWYICEYAEPLRAGAECFKYTNRYTNTG